MLELMGNALASRSTKSVEEVMDLMTKKQQAASGKSWKKHKVEATLDDFKVWCNGNQPSSSLSSLFFFLQVVTMVGSQHDIFRLLEVFSLDVEVATEHCAIPGL